MGQWCTTIKYMNPSNDSKKIIIVEDNTALAEIYKTRLELLGYTCFVAYNGITGLYFIQKEVPDLVLLDLMIPDISGGQLLATMRATDWGKNIPVYVISNLNETEAPKDLRDLGISGYSVKAMMTEDTVDKIVNGILRPDMQPEPVSTPDTPPTGATLADVPFHEAPQ